MADSASPGGQPSTQHTPGCGKRRNKKGKGGSSPNQQGQQKQQNQQSSETKLQPGKSDMDPTVVGPSTKARTDFANNKQKMDASAEPHQTVQKIRKDSGSKVQEGQGQEGQRSRKDSGGKAQKGQGQEGLKGRKDSGSKAQKGQSHEGQGQEGPKGRKDSGSKGSEGQQEGEVKSKAQLRAERRAKQVSGQYVPLGTMFSSLTKLTVLKICNVLM